MRRSQAYQAQMSSDGLKALVFGEGEVVPAAAGREGANTQMSAHHIKEHSYVGRHQHQHQKHHQQHPLQPHKKAEHHPRPPSVTFAADVKPPAARRQSAPRHASSTTAALPIYPSSLAKKKPPGPTNENQAPRQPQQHRQPQYTLPAVAPFLPLTYQPRPRTLGTNQPMPSYSLLGSLGPYDQYGLSSSSSSLGVLPPRPPPLIDQCAFVAASSSTRSRAAPVSFPSLPSVPTPPLPSWERVKRHANRINAQEVVYWLPALSGHVELLGRTHTRRDPDGDGRQQRKL